MAVDLRFWRSVEATPGPVALRFADAPTQTDVTGAIAASLPAAQLPALGFTAQGNSYAIVTGALAATLPPASLTLTFEAIEAPASVTIAATLPAPQLPGVSLVAAGEQLQSITVTAALPAATLPELSASASGTYDSALPDAIGPRAAPRHASALPVSAGLATGQHAMRPAVTPAHAPHTSAAPLPSRATLRQSQMQPLQRRARLEHQHGAALAAGTRQIHAEHIRTRARLAQHHQHGLPVATGTSAPHAERIRLRRRLRAEHTSGIPVAIGARPREHNGRPTATRASIPHASAIPLPVGLWRPADLPPVEPPNPYSSPVHLLFWQANDGTTRLRFGKRPPQPGVVIPIREVYFVINTFTLARADTGQPVEVTDFSASIDADSWTWGWSASMHADLMPLVRSPALGEHVELIASINGTPLRLVVERMGRDRRFASSQLKISGRGRAAWLSDPHSPVATRYNTAQRTAQQLLNDALTINNVSIGWTVDWRITDWLVPAGAWSHQGTYMDAVTRIAEAGGGYVQAHNTDQQLIILPRYPVAPWLWASQTPDIELPEDVCEVEGIEWQDRPAYNAVYVSGGEAGRRDRIRRTGTAADRNAPTIIDPLATAPEMTRQRGLAALGDTGRQAHITLRLPVLAETGIIPPGKLIRYTESGVSRLGLSRAVQVDQQFPNLWQTIRIETHELEPI
ncbi:MAG: hypothetical protein Dbin4_02247 [Alphaproteobacteria bacterium]|nr:hypothetical protein [Alphaproteobacteria bacterium]